MISNKNLTYCGPEKSACGVGFIASRNQEYSNEHLLKGLHALRCVEHRGACAADGLTGDGAGIMTDIPFELLGYDPDTVAVATLFLSKNKSEQLKALKVFESTFSLFGLDVLEYRDVPVNNLVLGKSASESVPDIKHAVINRPSRAITMLSFDKRLYTAKQLTKSKLYHLELEDALFFTSLSAKTIVYKALTQSYALEEFYLDLKNPKYVTRFCLFHRRFSTNTTTSWDKAQPFRLIGHNGEINTIAGNRSWAKSREKMIGAEKNEILTRLNISDSGSLNEMVESLRYRSSIPNVEDILAICMPPATEGNKFYKFWSRAMEPWDGPALITYANGYKIGARLDRNGFRPCRWVRTKDHFYLSSEAGTFNIDEATIEGKGTLYAGRGVTVDLTSGDVLFRDPSYSKENYDAPFDARVELIPEKIGEINNSFTHLKSLFCYTDEELTKIIYPMAQKGKEPIGSMGDTARLAVLSNEPRSFFDFFFQNFSQVTNPPLDYLREKIVTDLTVYLGKKPNIFEPKELIPPAPAYELKSPFLSLKQMDFIYSCIANQTNLDRVIPHVIDTTFNRSHGVIGFKSRLDHIEKEAVKAVKAGHTILILSDRKTSLNQTPLPSLLTLRKVVNGLNDEGLKLNAAVIVDTGEIKSTHHAAALIGFGAQAVCPYLALDIARNDPHRSLKELDANSKEKNILNALEHGLLKVMAKMGISVVRSYQSAKLFSALGLGNEVIQEFFPGIQSPIGGLEIEQIAQMVLDRTKEVSEESLESYKPIKSFQYKEHTRGKLGEKHSMTNSRSKMIHELVQETGLELNDWQLYDEYLKLGLADEPVALRHLFTTKSSTKSTHIDEVKDASHILRTFGSGAMSFGAISAESQRDIFLAMKEIGGRCNSGEGGENPYYFKEGIGATIKQIASGRFGVTAEYLVSGEEIQIKVCQGAKPGEGGQLMGIKVNVDIAKARFANPGFDLISPPPLHDIYSIEDLKQLINDLKQIHPKGKVGVKLVAGVNIGTIAVGVAKAGADTIQVSGGEGGTGAASLSSMKHAGLPWEIGLLEVHQALVENNLRDHVVLRTDGGLSCGKDIVLASILGAEEFDFGKMLLIAQGCVMARICEKNTCPRGIATHDPKFKAKYVGHKDHIVKTMKYIAEDVRRILAQLGKTSLEDICGDTTLLSIDSTHLELINELNLDLGFFLDAPAYQKLDQLESLSEPISELNATILSDLETSIQNNENVQRSYQIINTDRSALATLFGELASRISKVRMADIKGLDSEIKPYTGKINLEFNGSAGQSFGVFQTKEVNIKLIGEANDSVCKSMSGGKTVILPPTNANYKAEENAIIGNCALYGATGGSLFVHGQAGDRFAVRNSGATAVVEGTGLHACEYMTNGTVVILGQTSENIGAGMTGGILYMYEDPGSKINSDYIAEAVMSEIDLLKLKSILEEYASETGSKKATYTISDWETSKKQFKKFIPLSLITVGEGMTKTVPKKN
jgi:glutamate synthase domain-containing protein 2/glutamate synthase domain-containing protein 1/glutamate synthase domain-containing protein 3